MEVARNRAQIKKTNYLLVLYKNEENLQDMIFPQQLYNGKHVHGNNVFDVRFTLFFNVGIEKNLKYSGS